jgi:ABC-2 type transport system ATP-binding protein
MTVLRVEDAKKAFGTTQALCGVSLELGAGELLGLLGPNGAGKTTLVRALAGRVRLDGGTIELFGHRLSETETRDGLGVVPQEIALYPLLTARENLEAFGSFNGLRGAALRDRVAWALEWTGLSERAREPIRRFSGGMRRRLNIACGVLHEPRVILLDEPTVGVDPQSRERIYEMLDRLRANGVSLLLTTHQLDEAEARCERIVIVDHGRVIAAGTLGELVRDTVGGGRVVTVKLDRAPAAPIEGLTAEGDGTVWCGPVRDVDVDLAAVLRRVAAAQRSVVDLEVRQPSLQSVFLHLTGRELRE